MSIQYETFTIPIIINLPSHGEVKNCLFKKKPKIVLNEIGTIEHCIFEDGAELETEYTDFPDNRKFKTNILYKKIEVKGGISIKNNIFHSSSSTVKE